MLHSRRRSVASGGEVAEMEVTERHDEFVRSFDESPYALLLGMRVVEASRGRARLSLELREEHLNHAGLIHGGVVMSLADHAFGCATNSLGRPYVAVQFGISLLAAPTVGTTIYADAEVLHAGRRAGTAEMTVRDSKGKVLAKALGTVVALGDGERPTGDGRASRA